MINSGLLLRRYVMQILLLKDAADQDSKNHICFCLPFIMVKQEDGVVEDGGDRVKA